jgi:hypothetical protein
MHPLTTESSLSIVWALLVLAATILLAVAVVAVTRKRQARPLSRSARRFKAPNRVIRFPVWRVRMARYWRTRRNRVPAGPHRVARPSRISGKPRPRSTPPPYRRNS